MDAAPAYKKRRRKDEPVKKWDPQTVFNFFLMVFTGLLVYCAFQQNWATELTARAYVVRATIQSGTIEVNGHPMIQVALTNRGNTDAKVTSCQANIVRVVKLPDATPASIIGEFQSKMRRTPQGLLIQPKGNLGFAFVDEAIISPDDKFKIDAGSLGYYIYGYATYVDGFSEPRLSNLYGWLSQERIAPFCGRYMVNYITPQPGQPPPAIHDYWLCPESGYEY